ncbi:MAG: 16S rRNA (guanine(527)-N(7))-methyltransferase RsmG, partial [Phycisphaerales bacterium]|nr:16S rRNA (guanine(527)-N(7))-methyltransferase RsmG [Phycisphaerales bacterium]
GGLPGIPLAIVCPEIRFTLLEATGKKARFLQQMVDTLPLPNARIVNDRAEVAAHDRDTHRAQYDLVIARAVGPLPVLLELTIPFAREGGFVLAIKGERAAEEIEQSRQALHLLHSAVAQTVRTPTSTIVVIEKSRTTPRIYPRRPGEPKRAPLGIGSAKGKSA